jgi:hypothetical protein
VPRNFFSTFRDFVTNSTWRGINGSSQRVWGKEITYEWIKTIPGVLM